LKEDNIDKVNDSFEINSDDESVDSVLYPIDVVRPDIVVQEKCSSEAD
jgi:hypothetical protein